MTIVSSRQPTVPTVPARPTSGAGVAVVVSGWPRLSETFALNELLALEGRGLLAGLYATKPGDDTLVQPDVARLDPQLRRLGGHDAATQAAELARLIATGPRPVTAIHGYFAHRPTEVAERAAELLGLPFSFSVHALDARKVEGPELARRCRAAALVTTCNPDVSAVLRGLGAEPVELPHGVDLDRFRPSPPPDATVVELLAVGRLVEKKGFIHLVAAMAHVGPGIRLRIVGDGPWHEQLARRIAQEGLTSSVLLAGRLTHAELPAAYRAADLVVVPSVVDQAGDRDGLPNVVLEAMASGRPVVASRVAAVPSAVDGSTGVLVEPGDPEALAAAVRALADDRPRRHRLGRAARERAEARYGLDHCSAAWADLLAATHTPASHAPASHTPASHTPAVSGGRRG